MHTIVVVNGGSGRARAAIGRLPEMLARHGIAHDDFVVATDHRRLCRIVRRAVKDGARRVVVGGGDGTMAAAVRYLAHADAVLGVLPLGTGNSFAMTLGVPHDVDAALAVVAAGRVARVDLGCVNDVHFANFATIGLAAEVARVTTHEEKRRFGPLAYAVAAIRPLLRHRPFRARLRSDEGRHEAVTQQVLVACGRYFGHEPLTPDASPVDGRLAVFLTEGRTPLASVRDYAALALGRQTSLPGAMLFSTERLTVKARPKQRISVDGDDAGRTPARFRVEPGALRVFVPETFVAGTDRRHADSD